MRGSQGAALERVGVAVRGLIRLWKSVEKSKPAPFTKIVKYAAPDPCLTVRSCHLPIRSDKGRSNENKRDQE
jgi:hypothetical protein